MLIDLPCRFKNNDIFSCGYRYRLVWFQNKLSKWILMKRLLHTKKSVIFVSTHWAYNSVVCCLVLFSLIKILSNYLKRRRICVKRTNICFFGGRKGIWTFLTIQKLIYVKTITDYFRLLSQSIIKLSKCLLKNDWFTYPFDKINHNYFFERFSIF